MILSFHSMLIDHYQEPWDSGKKFFLFLVTITSEHESLWYSRFVGIVSRNSRIRKCWKQFLRWVYLSSRLIVLSFSYLSLFKIKKKDWTYRDRRAGHEGDACVLETTIVTNVPSREPLGAERQMVVCGHRDRFYARLPYYFTTIDERSPETVSGNQFFLLES